MLSIGLMSGTSMDGIDAALIETDGRGSIKALGHSAINYSSEFKILLKSAELAVKHCRGDLASASVYFPQAVQDYMAELKLSGKDFGKTSLDEVIQQSTLLHSQVVKQLLEEKGYRAAQIDVIGYHGQTLYHAPEQRLTVQVGDGRYLAELLGITVINNFRQRDVAAGGQGAPFAPLYHQALAIRDQKMPLAVVNCGGIANITIINSNNPLELIAFDTGPGNSLIDRFIRRYTGYQQHMDKDGLYGQHGKVNDAILQALYASAIIKEGKNFFECLPPKSLDYNDITLIDALNELTLEDACRTLEAFTADTIVKSLDLVTVNCPSHWILAGGGWRNPIIKEEFTQRLIHKLGKPCQIQTADEAGWHSQALEAQIFAYLAVRSLENLPISVPSTTHVPMPLSGGHAHLPASGATEAVKLLLKANPAVLTGYQ